MPRRRLVVAAVLASLVASCAAPARAQAPDPELEALRERLRALEERLATLEGGGAPPPAADAAPVASDAPAAAGDGPLLRLELPLSVKLSAGGKLRVRGEWRDPESYRLPGTFGRPATDDPDDGTDFVEQRTRLWLAFDIREPLRAVIEVQDSRTWGDTAIGADTAELHVRRAFVEVHDLLDVPLSLQVGRLEVPALGDQRLISPLDWSNVGRSWDGAQLTFEPEGWLLTAFAANVREGAVFSPRGDVNDFWFAGVYVSCREVERHELDLYLYWRHLSDRVFTSEAGRVGDRKDFTAGARVKGQAAVLEYSGELAWQWGDQAGDQVEAWGAATKVGVTLGEPEGLQVRLGAEYAFASGDRDPTDGRNETFDPLLPFGHFYHGHLDQLGWRNVHAVSGALAVSPMKALSFHADVHSFWLEERADAWYDAAKNPVRRDATGQTNDHIGVELDLYVKWRLWERLSFWGGYSRFWPGKFVRHTGFDEPMDWAFLLAEVAF